MDISNYSTIYEFSNVFSLALIHLADDLVEKGVERGHNIMCEHITKPPFIISLSYYITPKVRLKGVFVSYFYIIIFISVSL